MSLLSAFLEEDSTSPPSIVLPSTIRNVVEISIRTDGVLGTGAPDNPYNGSTQLLLDNLLFNRNDALTTIAPDMTIRFGPGIFQTRGFGAAEPGFRVLSGQRFVGSGIYQTVLQLVKATPLPGIANGAVIFGTDGTVSDVVISDLTLDCNAARQPLEDGTPALLSLTGVYFPNGSRIRLKRVRIINWGTHTPYNTVSATTIDVRCNQIIKRLSG